MEKDRSRRWQLTENNADYTTQECGERLASVGHTRYVVAGRDIGESGTKHIHAFVIYDNAISLTTLRKQFPRAHFEACIRSNIENREYVIKNDTQPYESGDMPVASESDRKTDFASEVINLLENGVPLSRIMLDYPALCDYVVRNYRSLKEIEHDFGYKRVRR